MEQKLCTNCKYFKHDIPFFWITGLGKCSHPNFANPVNGKATDFCSALRVYRCGPTAIYWEQK